MRTTTRLEQKHAKTPKQKRPNAETVFWKDAPLTTSSSLRACLPRMSSSGSGVPSSPRIPPSPGLPSALPRPSFERAPCTQARQKLWSHPSSCCSRHSYSEVLSMPIRTSWIPPEARPPRVDLPILDPRCCIRWYNASISSGSALFGACDCPSGAPPIRSNDDDCCLTP